MPFGQHARIDAGLDLLLTRIVLKKSGFIVGKEDWRAPEHHAIGAVFGWLGCGVGFEVVGLAAHAYLRRRYLGLGTRAVARRRTSPTAKASAQIPAHSSPFHPFQS